MSGGFIRDVFERREYVDGYRDGCLDTTERLMRNGLMMAPPTIVLNVEQIPAWIKAQYSRDMVEGDL